MAQVTGYDRHKFEVSRFDDSFYEAHCLLMKAADKWAQGHPEEPPTFDVLDAILDVFANQRLLTRPYGCRRKKS